MLIFVTLPKPSTKKPRVWASGFLLLKPMTPRHFLLPSHKLKSMPLSNAFRWASPLPSCTTRTTILVTFAERKDIRPTHVQTRLVLHQSLTPTLPSPLDDLWDLKDILDAEIHMRTADTTNKDEENSNHTNKVGNIFL